MSDCDASFVSKLMIKSPIFFCFSDSFVQCDNSTFPRLPSLASGSEQPAQRQQTSLQSEKSDRASASGASLRRGDAEVQVGELPPQPANISSAFAFPADFLLHFPLFVFLNNFINCCTHFHITLYKLYKFIYKLYELCVGDFRLKTGAD